MKLHLGFVSTMLVLVAISCQRVDEEKEKAAILDVLKEEAAATIAGDFERYKATHIQDELETRVEMGIYSYNVMKGWEEIGRNMEDFVSGNPLPDYVNRKENIQLKVNGNSAWLICDNIWETNAPEQEIVYNNLQIIFLEKVQGEWKISFAANYGKGTPDEEF